MGLIAQITVLAITVLIVEPTCDSCWIGSDRREIRI